MNILIKLTCLIGLVIAPILGNGHNGENKVGASGTKMEECHGKSCCKGDMKTCDAHMKGEKMIGKCDMRKCAKMSKEECAAMCDELKCTPEEKEMCLAHYDANGKFMGGNECTKKAACCADKSECKDKSKCKDKSNCKETCKK